MDTFHNAVPCRHRVSISMNEKTNFVLSQGEYSSQRMLLSHCDTNSVSVTVIIPRVNYEKNEKSIFLLNSLSVTELLSGGIRYHRGHDQVSF